MPQPHADLGILARSILHRASTRPISLRSLIIGGALVLPLAITVVALVVTLAPRL